MTDDKRGLGHRLLVDAQAKRTKQAELTHLERRVKLRNLQTIAPQDEIDESLEVAEYNHGLRSGGEA